MRSRGLKVHACKQFQLAPGFSKARRPCRKFIERNLKTKMVLQVCAAAVLIAGARHPRLSELGLLLLWLVVISALVSAAQYFYRFWNQLDDRIKQRRKLGMLEAQKKPQDAIPL